jgi:hypothetical protein
MALALDRPYAQRPSMSDSSVVREAASSRVGPVSFVEMLASSRLFLNRSKLRPWLDFYRHHEFWRRASSAQLFALDFSPCKSAKHHQRLTNPHLKFHNLLLLVATTTVPTLFNTGATGWIPATLAIVGADRSCNCDLDEVGDGIHFLSASDKTCSRLSTEMEMGRQSSRPKGSRFRIFADWSRTTKWTTCQNTEELLGIADQAQDWKVTRNRDSGARILL